jgi:hypothetical protein
MGKGEAQARRDLMELLGDEVEVEVCTLRHPLPCLLPPCCGCARRCCRTSTS